MGRFMFRQNGHKEQTEHQEFITFLGPGTRFKGVVNFEGTVQVDGRLEGEVHTKGTLIIGEQALIKGLITADIVICSGKVNGSMTANERVELHKPAVHIGDIRTPALLVEDGAHFHGRCDMGLSNYPWVDEVEEATEGPGGKAYRNGGVKAG